jgi:SAM-dependent methyltransferase
MVMTSAFHDFEHHGWQKAATQYGPGFGVVTVQAIGPLLDAVNAGPNMRLLDMACGPGYAAAAAAERGCSVIGIDFSSKMVALASGQNPGIEFREGDAERLDFPAGAFDAVVMNYGMLHLGNPEHAIAESYRVLRSGGRFAFTVWDVPDKAVGFGIVLQAIQAYGDTNVPIPPGPPFFRFSDPAESTRALEAAGFGGIRIMKVPQIWRLETPDALFTTMRTAAVRTAALLNMQKEKALQDIRAEIVNGAEQYRKGDHVELPMPAVLASGVKL